MPRRKQQTPLLKEIRETKKTTQRSGGVIVLENFSFSTLFKRETNTTDYLHYLIASPSFLFKDVDFSQITDMGDVRYPLLCQLPKSELSLTSGIGYPVANYLPSNYQDERILYSAFSTGRVLALKKSGVARDLGTPLSNPSLPNETSLATFIGKLFFVNPSSTSVYHIPEDTTGTSWTSLTEFNSPKFAVPFSVYLYIADKSSSSVQNRQNIKVYGTSLTLTGTFDLGTNWDIIDIGNNNNKFLVIIASPLGVKTNQYLFYWDGSYQNRYFNAIKLPGLYLGSLSFQGTYLIFLKTGNNTKIYEISGYALKYLDTFPNTSVNTTLLPSARFSSYGNYVFFIVKKKDVDANVLVAYNPIEREIFTFYLDNSSKNFIQSVAVLDGQEALRVFYNDTTQDKISQILLIPETSLDYYVQNYSNPFQEVSFNYVSNLINLIRRSRIDKVEVFYGTKPANSNQGITIEITGMDSRSNQSKTTTLEIDNQKQDYYWLFSQVGLIGDKVQFKIKFKTDGNFKGNLKRLIAYYTYID